MAEKHSKQQISLLLSAWPNRGHLDMVPWFGVVVTDAWPFIKPNWAATKETC